MDRNVLEASRLWTLALPTVSAFVTSLVRDFQDRDDVLQESAVAVMESFDRFDPTHSFVGWALGIARNQVFLYYRRKDRQKVVFDTETVEAIARAFSDRPAEDVRLDHLSQCLGSLEAKSRDLCRLRYDEDLKPAGIAARTGMASNAVAKALQRIRDRLRECIERKLREASR